MRYFVLKQDERITNIPYPMDFFQNIDARNISAEKGDLLPPRTLLQLRPSKSTVFPDILCTPALLLSREAQNIVKLFDEHIAYRQIIYLDQENELVQLYFMPLPETVDCLSKQSEYLNSGKGAFSKVVLKSGAIQNKSIFQVKNQTQRVIIVRLDLAEYLLSRDCKGFTLTEAEIET